jgi:hypothetical protein
MAMSEIKFPIPLTDMHWFFRRVNKLPHHDQSRCAERLVEPASSAA